MTPSRPSRSTGRAQAPADEATGAAPGPLNNTGYWLHQAALTWNRELARRLRPLGLTPTQFMVLSCAGWLAATQGAPTQQQVADLAGTDRMMTSRVMAALTAAGLLARTADPRSRRAKRVRPTEEGDRLVQAALASVREVEELLFGGSTTPRSMALLAELRAVCATDPA